MSNYENMRGLQQSFSEPDYNSDKELSPKEQNQIYSMPDPQSQAQVRNQIWEQKPAIDRYSRIIKRFVHGGDQADEQ